MSSIHSYIKNLKSSSRRTPQGARKKKLGPRHWIRLFFLIVITIVITWYSKQKYNNPYTPWPTIKITGNKNSIYLHCIRKVKEAESTTLVFLLSGSSPANKKQTPLNTGQIPTLITLPDFKDGYGLFTSPPVQWVVLGDSSQHPGNLTIPAAWPEPVHTGTFNTNDNIEIHYVYPFSDTLPCIHFTHNTIEILIINNTFDLPETMEESVFKERYDLILFYHIDEMCILKIHKLLRPQYSIDLAPLEGSPLTQSMTNIIRPDSDTFTFSLAKDKKNRVYITKSD